MRLEDSAFTTDEVNNNGGGTMIRLMCQRKFADKLNEDDLSVIARNIEMWRVGRTR